MKNEIDQKNISHTLIFDFDGTIADSADMLMDVYNRLAPQYKCKQLTVEAREVVRNRKPQELMKEYGVRGLKIPSMLIRMRKEFLKNIGNVRPFPGILEPLKYLTSAGYTLGIISSNAVENINSFLITNNMGDLFTFVYSGNSVFGKDRVIRKVMRKKKLAARSTIYIGDETRDVEAAKRAGISVVAVCWGYQSGMILSKSGPDQIASDPADLALCIDRTFQARDAIEDCATT